jgi:outer membrane protein assembly factor BamB
VWKGAVYVGTIDGRLVSLDAKTGAKRWEVNTIDRTKPYSITGAPRVVKDKVLIGNGGGEMGVRGYFSAYDADTGKLVWRFYTVPGNPKDGFEHPELAEAAKTWNGEWWVGGGGGTVGLDDTTRSSTRSTSARATGRRGRATSARPVAATISISPRFSR